MSLAQFRLTIVASWSLISLVAVVGGLVQGLRPSLGEGFTLVLLWGAPTLVFLMVCRGAPPRSVGEVLYNEEREASTRAETRERLARLVQQ